MPSVAIKTTPEPRTDIDRLRAEAEERRSKGGRVRPMTLQRGYLTRVEKEASEDLDYPEDIERPRTRADCQPAFKSCPHCKEVVVMRIGGSDVAIDQSRGAEVRKVDGAAKGRHCESKQMVDPGVVGEMRLRENNNGVGEQSSQRLHKELRVHTHATREVRDTRIQCMEVDASEMYEPTDQVVQVAWSERDNGLRTMDGRGRIFDVHARHGEPPEFESQPGPDRQQRKLRADQLSMGNGNRTAEEPPHVSCPKCGGRVWYRFRVGGEDWDWQDHDQGATESRLDTRESGADASVILNRCRPCGFVSCKHHLYLDVIRDGGNGSYSTPKVKLAFPHLEVDELKETCSLDVAARGGAKLEQVGDLLNVTRERARQIEVHALAKGRRNKKLRVYVEP